MKTYICALAAGALLAASLDAPALVTVSATGGGPLPPVCDRAAASVDAIWPPDHKMVAIRIIGVTDPSGLALTITINSITQDEPVEVAGSGNTAPDGAGLGTSTAFVRAERAGPGRGRLYFISFSAVNSGGANCTGMVRTFVPHDQGQHFIPVDTGERYVSTATE
jgi:hypothetical protein